jgi:urease accessory protein
MCSDTTTLLSLFRLAQLSDSALPVGAFSFSLGLEAAVNQGLVCDLKSLEDYTLGTLRSVAECDGVALLEGFRAATVGDHQRLFEADRRLFAFKSAEEQRTMTCKMGYRLSLLLHSITPAPLSERLVEWIEGGAIKGTYPTAQAVAGVVLGTSERALFVAHLYGTATMILSASLRLVRLSHFDTQRILYRMGNHCEGLYEFSSERTLEDISSFAPTLSLAASLHERGVGRLFMN